MKNEVLFLNTMPDSNNIWKQIGGNYEDAQQSINELVDNAISNIIGNNAEQKKIEITLEESNDIDQAIYITIEDSGRGIANAAQAFTIGNIGTDSVFNEHGFGLKQALAAANPTNDDWVIYKRTTEEKSSNRMMKIEAPYVIGKQKYQMLSNSKWPGHVWGNTYIKVRCEYRLFQNVIQMEESLRHTIHYDFDVVADRIYEDLGFVYATLIENNDIEMKLKLKHANGTKVVYNVDPLLPFWADKFVLENSKLHLSCNSGHIEKLPDRIPFNNKTSDRYYKQNTTSSGVEIRTNGRVIEHNMFEKIFGKKNHPSFNSLLIQVMISADSFDDLPETRTTKNGFRIGDKRLSEITAWIRNSIQPSQKKLVKPVTVSETEEKRKLAQIIEQTFYENKELELQNYKKLTEREVPVFTSVLKSSYPKIDILVTKDDKISVIEAKKEAATIKDIYQLKMYCDGYFLDKNKMPDEAILVAKEFPEGLRRLIAFFNEKREANYPLFSCKYWNEFKENFEECLINEKKLKMRY